MSIYSISTTFSQASTVVADERFDEINSLVSKLSPYIDNANEDVILTYYMTAQTHEQRTSLMPKRIHSYGSNMNQHMATRAQDVLMCKNDLSPDEVAALHYLHWRARGRILSAFPAPVNPGTEKTYRHRELIRTWVFAHEAGKIGFQNDVMRNLIWKLDTEDEVEDLVWSIPPRGNHGADLLERLLAHKAWFLDQVGKPNDHFAQSLDPTILEEVKLKLDTHYQTHQFFLHKSCIEHVAAEFIMTE